ncbi:hypothetical protein RRG08_044272 [Elysia crispata]|uniref:Uncharacterized protein n=1 Tax=Elysia crispata TaxID=231223 RepID=A0AAE0XX08_9GAST|nr:hypothetical protein RRG08_044272 [Elysia crispata]
MSWRELRLGCTLAARGNESRPVRAASTPNTRGLECSPQTPTGITTSSGCINLKHKRTRVFTSNTDRNHGQFGPHQPQTQED